MSIQVNTAQQVFNLYMTILNEFKQTEFWPSRSLSVKIDSCATHQTRC